MLNLPKPKRRSNIHNAICNLFDPPSIGKETSRNLLEAYCVDNVPFLKSLLKNPNLICALHNIRSSVPPRKYYKKIPKFSTFQMYHMIFLLFKGSLGDITNQKTFKDKLTLNVMILINSMNSFHTMDQDFFLYCHFETCTGVCSFYRVQYLTASSDNKKVCSA